MSGVAEQGGLQTYLRPLALKLLGASGHDGIRARGSQSMTAASRATIVLGGPGAGPTCSTVTLFASGSSSVWRSTCTWGRPPTFSSRRVSPYEGKGPSLAPDRPDYPG